MHQGVEIQLTSILQKLKNLRHYCGGLTRMLPFRMLVFLPLHESKRDVKDFHDECQSSLQDSVLPFLFALSRLQNRFDFPISQQECKTADCFSGSELATNACSRTCWLKSMQLVSRGITFLR